MTVPTLRCSISPASPETTTSELLVLGPSLGTTAWIFDSTVTVLRTLNPALRILRYDLPGHGSSPAAVEPFTPADIVDAVLKLVDDTGGGRFHYAGVSFGGTVGIELAVRHPERLLSLGIICSDAQIGSATAWADRAAQVRAQGTPSLVGATPGRWFASDFISRQPEQVSRVLLELCEVDDESYALCCEALARFDRSLEVAEFRLPTVVVSGEIDPVTTPDDLSDLADRIPGASYEMIAGASHVAMMENPEAAAQILAKLVSTESAYDRGMTVRRSILGDAHVDAAQAKIVEETVDFQDFLTRYAWGEIWDRPGLGRRERSIATLASLVTGIHENEIGMHVRAALTNGLTRIEIAEVIMHTALYAGLPAANSAFAIASTIFAETDPDESE